MLSWKMQNNALDCGCGLLDNCVLFGKDILNLALKASGQGNVIFVDCLAIYKLLILRRMLWHLKITLIFPRFDCNGVNVGENPQCVYLRV